MTIHQVDFPATHSYGSSGGSSYNTLVLELDNGTEYRVSRREAARRRYNVAWTVKSPADLASLQDFFIKRKGAAFGFRFKDFLDFTSASDNISAQANTDQEIGVGDGSTTQFQLKKIYTDTANSVTRNITQIVTGSVSIAFDGVNQASGWTVNTATGIVTFTSAPSSSVVITAGFEFRIPVRFSEAAGEILEATYEDFSGGSIRNVELIEIVDELEVNELMHYGGAASLSFGANYTLSVSDGRVINATATTGSLQLRLPSTTGLTGGGIYFFIYNAGANTFSVRKNDGTAFSPAVSLTTGQSCIVNLGSDWVVTT